MQVNEGIYYTAARARNQGGCLTSTVIKIVAIVEMDPATGSKFMNLVRQFNKHSCGEKHEITVFLGGFHYKMADIIIATGKFCWCLILWSHHPDL